jgi:predicted nucleic acid-binding protein
MEVVKTNANAARYVLDSSALLAYLADEAGAGQVQRLLADGKRGSARTFMSVINLGEVLYITERHRGLEEAQRIAGVIEQLPILVVDADRVLTFRAAHVKANHAISYADSFAVAMAQEFAATVVTGDPEFERVEHLVSVMWIAAP